MRKITKDKKAAMEMSVGTIVTIVLLMSMLVLGIVLIRNIFGGAQDAVGNINTGVQNEIQKLFDADSSKKIVVYPTSREITLKKGSQDMGFAVALRNLDSEEHVFSYEVFPKADSSCGRDTRETMRLIPEQFRVNRGIRLNPGSIMEYPNKISFNIPEEFPPCMITYTITVENENGQYGNPVEIYVNIESK